MMKKMKNKSTDESVTSIFGGTGLFLTGNGTNEVINGSHESVGVASDTKRFVHDGLVVGDDVYSG